MKIVLHTEEDLEFLYFQQPGMEIEAANSGVRFSALQMFATSLAMCTYSMLASYGDTIDADSDGLRMRVSWSYVEEPFRIGNIDMDIQWPEVPDSRIKAAQAAASHCTVHHTLEQPPEIATVVRH